VKLVRDATWTDVRGVVHVVEWGIAVRSGLPGYFLACRGTMIAAPDTEDHTPTCVYCVAGT